MKKLLIVSEKQQDSTTFSYQNKRLVEEAAKFDIAVEVIGIDEIKIGITSVIKISYKGSQLESIDFVIFEVLGNIGLPLVLGFEQLGAKILNIESYKIISSGYSKIFQMSLLAAEGIPTPNTQVISSTEEFLNSVNAEVIIKPNIGKQGKDIFIGDETGSKKALEKYNPNELLIQEKLPNRTDYRVLVLNGNALGIMKKEATGENIVSNYSHGGKISKFEDSDISEVAISAVEVMKCDFAGVDVMYDENGIPKILEVNRSAGFEGFEKVTDVNVAKEILEFLTN